MRTVTERKTTVLVYVISDVGVTNPSKIQKDSLRAHWMRGVGLYGQDILRAYTGFYEFPHLHPCYVFRPSHLPSFDHLNLLAPELFFLILAHSVYKM